MEDSTTLPQNLTAEINIQQKLEQIDSQLSNISTREVIVIVAICLLGVVTILNLILSFLQNRKKQRQDGIPQSIVIQPNGTSDKNGKVISTKLSMEDKDVLPSKSMKMRVAITPGSVSTRRVVSKEKIPMEDSSVSSKTENVGTANPGAAQGSGSLSLSQSVKKDKDSSLPPVIPTVPVIAEPALSEPKEAKNVPTPQPLKKENNVINITLTTDSAQSLPASTPPTVQNSINPPSGSAPPTEKSKASSSNDSMTSFTVPEENRTSMTSQSPKPDEAPKPSTPSATTLSGNPVSASGSKTDLQKAAQEPKLYSQVVASTPSNPPAAQPSKSKSKTDVLPAKSPIANLLKTPSKSTQPDMKVESLFPTGCGTGV